MGCIPLLTGSRASVFWGDDLRGQNLRFLESLDPGYFRFAAQSCSGWLDDASLKKPDRQRAALMLRVVHGQGVEALMALTAALAQSPQFPVGWMLRYKVAELHDVIQAISDEKPFPSLLREKPVTWKSLSSLVYNWLPDEELKKSLTAKFASFWHAVAAEFLSDGFRDEYNSLKHGFRVTPGGFSISIGPPKPAGQPSTPAAGLQSLGSSEFGSSLLKAVAIDGVLKHHCGVSLRLRNWNPEALIADLHLIENSLTNVISCLRVLSGFRPLEMKFSYPETDAAFEGRRRMLNEVETVAQGPGVKASDVKPVTPDDVRRGYDTAH